MQGAVSGAVWWDDIRTSKDDSMHRDHIFTCEHAWVVGESIIQVDEWVRDLPGNVYAVVAEMSAQIGNRSWTAFESFSSDEEGCVDPDAEIAWWCAGRLVPLFLFGVLVAFHGHLGCGVTP